MACLDVCALMVDMIYQLSNKYLLNTFMVYLDDQAGDLQVEMIDQISNKYLLDTFMVYLYTLPFELGTRMVKRVGSVINQSTV